MPKVSAGLLVHRVRAASLEVLLVHPGGPFWAKKDFGAWTIPKGEPADGEDLLACARREFTEETGFSVAGPFASLGTARQAGGKVIHAFLAAGDFDAAGFVSNTFKLEWPPRSGRWTEFPEVDRAEWLSLAAAAEKINPAQRVFLDRIATALPPAQLGGASPPSREAGPR
jgi:predicted NUDIX family NTP pyrophosphohydrolase